MRWKTIDVASSIFVFIYTHSHVKKRRKEKEQQHMSNARLLFNKQRLLNHINQKFDVIFCININVTHIFARGLHTHTLLQARAPTKCQMEWNWMGARAHAAATAAMNSFVSLFFFLLLIKYFVRKLDKWCAFFPNNLLNLFSIKWILLILYFFLWSKQKKLHKKKQFCGEQIIINCTGLYGSRDKMIMYLLSYCEQKKKITKQHIYSCMENEHVIDDIANFTTQWSYIWRIQPICICIFDLLDT